MTSSFNRNAPEYGTVEYYSEQFSDVMADIGEDDTSKGNVLKGLHEALVSWINYHDSAACRFEDFAIELDAIVKVIKNV